MKKILIIIMLVLLSSFVYALNPGEECQTYCSSSAEPVAKWEWEGSSYIEELDWHDPSYTTSVAGDALSAEWASDPAVECIIHKEGQDFYDHTGGISGTITKISHDISHITLCAQKNYQVPEFTTLTAVIALAGAVGFSIFRKRRKD